MNSIYLEITFTSVHKFHAKSNQKQNTNFTNQKLIQFKVSIYNKKMSMSRSK